MDSLKKNLTQTVKLGVFATLLCTSALVQAEPNDALEQLIKQRQQATQPESNVKINHNFIQRKAETTVPAPEPIAKADKSNTKVMTAAQALSIFRPHASTAVVSNSHGDADSLISSAMGFIGVAYRFGGTTPRGFDCSGFMQYVFRKAFAVNIPRTAAAQANFGSKVSRSNLQAGDMVFFRTSGRRISHVGMYVSNDRFIHSPRTGKSVEITSLSSKYWSSKYATARRVKRQGADNFIKG